MTNREIWEQMRKIDSMERKITAMIYDHSKKKDIVDMVSKLADENKSLCMQLLKRNEFDELVFEVNLGREPLFLR